MWPQSRPETALRLAPSRVLSMDAEAFEPVARSCPLPAVNDGEPPADTGVGKRLKRHLEIGSLIGSHSHPPLGSSVSKARRVTPWR